MVYNGKKESLVLFLGDIIFFFISLWIMLVVRYGGLPSQELFVSHAVPFSMLFAVWIAVFYIAGLYEKHTVFLKKKLPHIIFQAQVINSIIAVLFFYFIPYFGITPKTNLFIYLIISFGFMLLWRIYGVEFFGAGKKENAIIVASGSEMKELVEEVNNNSRYNIRFVSSLDLDKVQGVDFQQEIVSRVYGEDIHMIAIDLRNEKVEPILPSLYNLIFSKVHFIDMHKIYEDIFDRIPLSLVRYNWFLENISVSPKVTYDALKRVMDIIIAVILGIIALIITPFVMFAILIEDGKPFFFIQERVGVNNKTVRVIKFRSMSVDLREGNNARRITRVGAFLRKTRIDELPQLWNVMKGDLSLIGPRPEMPELVKVYEKEIPYYNIRHLIKPGLSGWAQLYQVAPPKFDAAASETKTKLSYDLYYIKNRSVVLDIKIALKTLKALISRTGV
ncbi:MAG: exopolysaccharide biosynthesis polyprenyl glycosylphosphotransferase [Candidatus Paceibacterota bacterium]|jgi:exopolysaccharide biosynthesis polyprenyl glycosylphosphotransferase